MLVREQRSEGSPPRCLHHPIIIIIIIIFYVWANILMYNNYTQYNESKVDKINAELL